MKKILMIVFLIQMLFISSLFAGAAKELDKATINKLKKSVKYDAATKALINAVSNNDVHSLVLNKDIVNNHNDVFNVKIDVNGITNQRSTGRCWIYACLNIMRPTTMEKFNIKSFKFSQSYLFFWDKIEKSNMFLEAIIETRKKEVYDREVQILLDGPASDGGWWNYVVDLIDKYGVVPQNFMPETKNTKKSRRMNHLIENLLRQNAGELRSMAKAGKKESELRTRKLEMLKEIYRLLVLHMGTPPEKFTWRYENKDGKVMEKEYTPLEFYKDAVGFDLNDYVTLVDNPSQEYNKHYTIKYCRNMTDAEDMNFVNMDIKKIKDFAYKSILDKEPVWFGADVGWHMEREHAIMADNIYDYKSLYGVDFNMSKGEKLQYKILTPSHAMAFVAVDTVDGKPVKWKVENSWGSDIGKDGYWSMYDNWFDKYMLTVIINKKYLPEDVLKLLKTKPKQLPAWDPLRSYFQ